MEYKIFYHQGEKFGMSTIVKIGTLIEDKKELFIVEKGDKDKIEIKAVKEVHKVDINGVGTVLKVELKDSNVIYMAAYKGICIANFFVRIDDLKTEEMEKSIILKK